MYNQVILVGNVASDIDVRATQSGTYVANWRLATNVYIGKDDDGGRKEATDFHSVVCFGKLAEFTGNHVKKGRQVLVTGRLHTSSWDDPGTGTKRYRTEVIAEEVKLLGAKPQAAESAAAA